MNNQWMKRTLLAISIQLVMGGAYAANEENAVDAVAEEATDVASDAVVDTVSGCRTNCR